MIFLEIKVLSEHFNFVDYFHFFLFLGVPCGMQDLSFQTRDRTLLPAVVALDCQGSLKGEFEVGLRCPSNAVASECNLR